MALRRMLAFPLGQAVSLIAHPASELRRDPARITIALAGDVMLGRMVNEAIGARGPRYIWGDVLPLLKRADLSLANLECVIAKGGRPFFPPRVFYFRARPAAAEALAIAGIDYVSLANNHAMDYSVQGLLETIEHLDRAGIAHAGAGPNLPAARKPAILEANGIRVGVISFADHFREYAATENMPGIQFIEPRVDHPDFSRVQSGILAARNAGADLVVFSIHWGPNMREIPPPDFVVFAHAVMDAGADMFHGHSAHIFQGIEIYNGKPICYDTGDLIDDYHVDPLLRNDQQLLFLAQASKTRIERVELVPLRIRDMQVKLARGAEFDSIGKRITQLSKPFATEITRSAERLLIDVARAA